MIYLRPYLTFFNLTLCIIFEICLILCILNTTKRKKPTKDSIMQYYLRYIDKYYITNIYMTSSAVIMYSICHILLLLFFRYLTLSTTLELVHLEPNVSLVLNLWPLFLMILKIILIVLAIILLYYILDLLFMTSVIKLYIYVSQTTLVYTLRCKITENIIAKLVGPLYLFIDNIATLNLALSEDNYDNHYEHRGIYEHDFILTLHIKSIILCEQYKIIQMFFIMLKKLLRLFYIHYNLDFLVYFIPGITLFSTFIYDVIVKQSLHNIYITLFIISVLRLIYKVYKFIDNKTFLLDSKLYNYFYKNEFPYDKQRWIFNVDTEDNAKIIQEESNANRSLMFYLTNEKYKIYIIQDLIKHVSFDAKIIQKRVNGMYIRFTLLVCGLILTLVFMKNYVQYTLYVLGVDLPPIILVLPIILLYITHLQIYKQKPNARIDDFSTYIYKRKYALMFWLLFIIQVYIFWLLIFKAYVFKMPDEYLFNCYNIQLLINLSIENKLEIFETYFKQYAQSLGFTKEYLEQIFNYKNEINLSDITLIKDIRIKEIKNHIEQLLNNYAQYVIEYHEELKQKADKTMLRMKRIRPFMDAFSTIINLITFWKFFTEYVNATYIIYKVPNLKTAKLAYWFVKILNKYLRKF